MSARIVTTNELSAEAIFVLQFWKCHLEIEEAQRVAQDSGTAYQTPPRFAWFLMATSASFGKPWPQEQGVWLPIYRKGLRELEGLALVENLAMGPIPGCDQAEWKPGVIWFSRVEQAVFDMKEG